MMIDTNSIVTATEANQNFSRVAKIAEKKGRVYVFKNNRPKLLVIDLDTEPQIDLSEDEKFEIVTKRILKEHRSAFEELAKWSKSPKKKCCFCRRSWLRRPVEVPVFVMTPFWIPLWKVPFPDTVIWNSIRPRKKKERVWGIH